MAKDPNQDQINEKVKELTQKWQKIPRKLFIGGEFVRSKGGKTFETINPANQETLCEEDIDSAVSAARSAYQSKDWAQMKPSKRAEIIRHIGDLVREHALELAVTETLDNGKTFNEAFRADLPPSWDIFHYYSGWATKIQGETIPVNGPFLNYTRREPLGVCGQIIPWNYPLLMAAWKIAPALATGNTVVLKPAEQTPLSALRLAEICKEAGVPDGVINVVPGFGEEAGAPLALHPKVDKVAFTGSTEVGKKILNASADSNLKKVSLELGGKSPQIIFADADIKQALKHTLFGIFANKGEVCSAGSRVYVEKPAYEKFIDELSQMTQKMMKLGQPQDLNTGLGALVSREQMKQVLSYIDKGKSSGARLVTGGKKSEEGNLAKGNFVEATIFADVANDSAIAQEEIFGPVLCVMPFDSEEEVIQKANDSLYGLVASVWTSQGARAHRIAHQIQAGTVWINMYNGFDSASPFGGYKQSGFGREMGMHALDLYTQIKSVWVNLR
jgi:acyl-CoA reductase-like NAD-dependent aldehyde dehydrogenase